jgi:DHA1 family bicyclomycin/chloramphenicol resistance-like MFS transporter
MDDSISRRSRAAEIGAGAPRYLIFFFGALVALGPLSIDFYLPAFPTIAEAFGVSVFSVQNTLSAFLVGYGCGQFLGGSLSDQIGRKRVGYIGLSTYVVASLAIPFTHTVEQMIVLRFLQAIGGGFSTVICMATVRDIYPVEQLGRRFATVTMVVLIAPLVAPMIGTLVLPLGWQVVFYLKAVYAACLLSAYAVLVPETRHGHWANLSLRSIFRQCGDVVTRRVDGRLLPIRYALAMAFATSVLMIFVTNASFIYQQYFAVPVSRFPYLFGLSVLGFMSMNLFSMRKLHADNAASFFRRGLTIQICAVAGLALVVLSARASLWTVVPFIILMVSTLGLIGPAGSARYMGFFTQLAGSASSVYSTMMFSFGGLLGALTGVFADGTLVPIVLVMAAAATTANLIGLTLPSSTRRASAVGILED